jgi:hypothetical protein
MAALAVLASVAIIIGVCFGAFLKLSFAIRREDRSGSLRYDAPNFSAQTARSLVGFQALAGHNSSAWD